MTSSRIHGFYKLARAERLAHVRAFAGLTDEEAAAFEGALSFETADRMVESAVGVFGLPLGVATNFVVNGRDVLVPMAIEEPSVVAAASNAAKIARPHGGFTAAAGRAAMIGQIQLVDLPDAVAAAAAIRADRARLLSAVNDPDSTLVKLGGGAFDVETRTLHTRHGEMLVVHLLVDVKDAMGANAVNTICERAAPLVAELSGGRALLRILSNLADRRVATARAVFDRDELGGRRVVDDIVRAWAFADADIYRAATHNKGILNGVGAVAVATGNDWRAVEAGAHAFAASTGRYRSLSRFYQTPEGHLLGEISLPLALGTVGGATGVHPLAKVNLKLLRATRASELAEVAVSVGLAQNVAALRALAAEGIQKGHMRLHARNLAIMAGASGTSVEAVAARLSEEGNVTLRRARELVAKKGKTG
ncbi:MAG: hydroxymethylglutaryl-CoA reductase, degradative [Methanobacteriota archaeon]